MLEGIKSRVDQIFRDRAEDGDFFELSEDVFCFRERQTSELRNTMYEPALCLIVQGAKQTIIDGGKLALSAGDTVLISHHVPVQAQITEASESCPYTALIVRLNMSIIRSLVAEIEEITGGLEDVQSVSSEKAELALLEAIDRLLGVLENSLESQLLGQAALKEVHLRVLQASHGGMLRALGSPKSPANRIARAIAFIRDNYKKPCQVRDVAAEAGMSETAFHQRFREVTGTTPNRYLKLLRLQEAHSLLSIERASVTHAALEVGYKSVNHFSRDYAKNFGMPPKEARAAAS
ncbi:AraC family transcriptional regulator [Parasphingopyxis algicola]|uniref:AraC family transcriptional regulator n=1 Tax=Parasphingopyxis algicola TaxID=2026624 RepID=UPI0015A48EBA|nr:AraC family transcriptional regulator [Parasphingopyxis algicola]QLC26433.1 AraC family transcriptional regulator [Parasphingopyxis algicola]